MRTSIAAIGFVLGGATSAAAESNFGVVSDPIPDAGNRATTSYDLGFVWMRFADATAPAQPFTAEAVRFGPRVVLGAHWFVGAETDIGRLAGQAPRDGSVARGGSATDMTLALTGKLAAAKVVAGVRTGARGVTGSAELATGVRLASYSSSVALSGYDSQVDYLLEGRGRLDLWIAPHVTVGGSVGIDLIHHDDLSVGVLVGYHFHAFDRLRAR